MRDSVLALYHRLPAPARSAAATLRGLYLRRWRYGPESERLIEAALDRDTWSAERWRVWRQDRLGYVLHRAATQVPYYRQAWARRRQQGDRASVELLENWPVLEKDVLRADPRAFVADDCDMRRMYREQTSGTTGKPLQIWLSRRTIAEHYALADARTARWHQIPAGARWARLGGQLVTPVRQRRPPFWVWNAAMRQLYLSTYHLAVDLIPHYLDALVRYRVVFLAGYPSSLLALAQQALALGRDDLKMLAAFTNAEPLHQHQRETISRAFHCPVIESYGMAEAVATGTECPAGTLHQWPEMGIIEVWNGDEPAPPGEPGEFICTGLLNADMPLIRYRVGDRGRLAVEDSPACPCGRTLPAIAGIEGRSTDLLVTPDGRQVFWINPVFYGLPVRQSQVVQESLHRLTVTVAPALGFDQRTERTIENRLRDRMGDLQIELRLVDEIPRTSNGKHRAVVCRLSAEERAAALRGAGSPAGVV